jgi:multidrug efflux system outer membrane protein
MKKSLPWLALTLLSACQNYHPNLPETDIPLSWKQTVAMQEQCFEKNRFWELFADPVLNMLEEEAIRANFDLQIAAYRIDQASALVKKERSKRLPHVNFNGSAEADETLLNPRFYGSPHHVERVAQRQYNLLADFDYELDLWGKFKAEQQSAAYREQAAQWEYEFIYQNVVTQVAIRYIQIRTLEEEIRFLTQAVQTRRATVDLHTSRVEAGCDPELDLSRAKLELSLAEVDLEVAKKLRAIEENALALLLGKPASSWTLSEGELPSHIPEVPAVLPSELLMRRADIQQQRNLVSAGRSDVNAAIKDYFPSFPLTAELGLSSPALKHLFSWQARYWQYALNILAPIYDGGQRKARVKLTKAAFHQAFAQYQKTVNQAFQDVEDALSDIHYLQLQYQAQHRAMLSAQDTFNLAHERYDTGLISYLLVADSESTTLDVSRRFIALKGERILAWIRLMRALGIQTDAPLPEEET